MACAPKARHSALPYAALIDESQSGHRASRTIRSTYTLPGPWIQEHVTLSFFSFLKRKPAPPSEPPRKPRAFLPTRVTKDRVILSKAAAHLRDTHEFRLAQAYASTKGLKLLLAIRPSAQIEPTLESYLRHQGVEVREAQMDDYSVYFGYAKHNGQEADGWVLGNGTALSVLSQSTRSLWLRDRLRIGAAFDDDGLVEFERALLKENSRMPNVDGENVREALLSLITAAKRDGGSLFIQ